MTQLVYMLRYLPLLSLLLLLHVPATAQLNLSDGPPAEETVIEFEQSEYDLGEVAAGDTVHATFRFRNAGQADLVIEHVKPSCACASLEFPEKPIPPGESGEIHASIDTADKEGEQEKYFAVIYNGNPPMERVTLRFVVKPRE